VRIDRRIHEYIPDVFSCPSFGKDPLHQTRAAGAKILSVDSWVALSKLVDQHFGVG